MISNPLPSNLSRIGLHYFPDSQHYREQDLQTWLPEILSIRASWLVLPASSKRAIPEFFIRGVIEAGIEPVIHLTLPIDLPAPKDSLDILFNSYARWGVHYVTIFDCPNVRLNWSPTSWTQPDLVERFLDLYLPLAELAFNRGLHPVFPPLQPGGDYWDTAFLRSALRGIRRRGAERLFERLVLGAYAWAIQLPLNWGAGGPERWPGARPYFTPPDAQDQRGFRIFDWYIPIARAELGQSLPILLLKVGDRYRKNRTKDPDEADNSTGERILAIAQAMAGIIPPTADTANILDPISSEVLSCNFWLLSSSEGGVDHAEAWFKPDRTPSPTARELQRWISGVSYSQNNLGNQTAPKENDPHPIQHYLLLPLYRENDYFWHLDELKNFILKNHPTIGFSIPEAALASHVTVAGGVQAFPDSIIDTLRTNGCVVDRIIGDGTIIAS